MPKDLPQRIIRFVAERVNQPLKVRALARAMDIPDAEYGAFRRTVRTLLDEGKLSLGGGQTLVSPGPKGDLVGRFRRNPCGFGFVLSEDPAVEDLFVPEPACLDAATGDLVRARRKKRGMRGGKMSFEGEIVAVLERGRSRVVGRLEKINGRWAVSSESDALHLPVYVADAGAKRARENDQVVVEIVQYPRDGHFAQGAIVEVLGRAGDPGVDTLTILRQHEIPDEFPAEVLEAARAAVDEYDIAAAAAEREDLTRRTVVTIDPQTARDFDDALSLRHLSHGHVELGVHIADVAHFVRRGSPLDAEARVRGNSVYFPRFVVPMLPELLSNGVCSLQEGEPRLTRSAFIEYDGEGRVRKTRFAATVIRSAKRLTYEEAQMILDGKSGGFAAPVVKLVKELGALAELIRRRRRAAGMLELDMPEVELILDDNDRVVDARPANNSFSHKLIEMAMVEANEAVARLLAECGVHALRRIHPEPDPAASEQLLRYLRAIGQAAPPHLDRFELQALLERVAGRPESYTVNLAVLRSLERASYAPQMVGHYALASEHYTHFTSPIRRYPDLTIHRLLDHYQRGELRRGKSADWLPKFDELVELGAHCSHTERRAEDAERELRALKLLQYLESKVGEMMPGVVSGVLQYGAFVQLDKIMAEGLVHLDSLPDDWWRYDAVGRTLAGERSGRRIAIGDRVRVQIAGVDMTRRKLDLVLVEHQSAPRMRRSNVEREPQRSASGKGLRGRRSQGRSPATKQTRGRGGGKRRRR